MPDIFLPQENIRPLPYPHLKRYAKAIHAAFWEPDHFTYDRDVRDFKIELTPFHRQVTERSMLSIGVVENKVKTFWARVDMRCPNKSVADVAHTFAGNEVVHSFTYEHLLDLLGLDKKFETIFEDVPCMDGRVKYLTKYLSGVNSRSNKEFTKSLILFTLLVENCSLFSQFLIISSFSKYRSVMGNFSTVINATAREEILHGKFGAELVNIIRNENPEWFDDEMEQKTRRAVRKAFKAEEEVLEWILEGGELEWLSKEEILEFLKNRLNNSMNQLGYADEFEVNEDLLEKSDYMERMLLSTMDGDFFNKKVGDYNKSNAYTEDSLWD